MKLSSCIKCGNTNNTLKSVCLPTKECSSWLKNMLPSTELYYIKTCINCGYTEMYSAKIVDRNAKKNITDTI